MLQLSLLFLFPASRPAVRARTVLIRYSSIVPLFQECWCFRVGHESP